MEGGPPKARERHLARDKMLPRERVGGCSTRARRSSSSAAGRRRLHDDEVPSAGMITGIGLVSGRACMVVATTRP